MHNSVYRKEGKRDYTECRMLGLGKEMSGLRKSFEMRWIILSGAFAEQVGC